MLHRDGLAEDVRVQFDHVVPITAYRADISPLLPAFRRGEVFRREKGGGARGAAEDGVGFADVFFQQTDVFAVFVADDAEVEFVVCVAQAFPFFGGVDVGHELARAFKVAVDDVDVVDIAAAQDEGEADVP